jgi:hypothetical protein
MNIGTDWLNDSFKGFLSARGDFIQFLGLSNVRILTAQAQYWQ